MNTLTACVGAFVAAYAVGGIPFSYLIGRFKGVDIRRTGSGNVGATNLGRAAGFGWGMTAFVCDALKGWLPVCWLPAAVLSLNGAVSVEVLRLTAAVGAVAGHVWTPYLRFRGGKGVATGAGALLAVAPAAAGIGLAAWMLAFALWRYVSLASLLAALAAAAAAWLRWALTGGGALTPAALSAIALLVVARHRANIRRLLAGAEARAGGATLAARKPKARRAASPRRNDRVTGEDSER